MFGVMSCINALAWNVAEAGKRQMARKKDVWDKDLRAIKLDKDHVKKQVRKYRIGSTRIGLGRICTREEFEENKKRILSRLLP
jgi:hypothetical protein